MYDFQENLLQFRLKIFQTQGYIQNLLDHTIESGIGSDFGRLNGDKF